MSPVIELLKTYDKQFREFTITGTKTDKDDNLVSVRESPYWRLLKETNCTRFQWCVSYEIHSGRENR